MASQIRRTPTSGVGVGNPSCREEHRSLARAEEDVADQAPQICPVLKRLQKSKYKDEAVASQGCLEKGRTEEKLLDNSSLIYGKWV